MSSTPIDQLKRERRCQGVPRHKIAAALNVKLSTISMYETGKRSVPLDKLKPWARAIGHNAVVLFVANGRHTDEALDTQVLEHVAAGLPYMLRPTKLRLMHQMAHYQGETDTPQATNPSGNRAPASGIPVSVEAPTPPRSLEPFDG